MRRRALVPTRSRLAIAAIYRRVTSPWRRMPDFIIIGAQKAGTSSLYFYLSQHPNIRVSATKEIHYYNYHVLRGKRLGWYRSFFPLKFTGRHQITGEASPYYLFDHAVPQRIKKDLPDVKLIALLRDPIDRAHSAYNMNKRQQQEDDFPTFEQAIANQDMSCEQSVLYLFRGRYADHLKHWLQYFSRDQFLFIKSEDFFRDPNASLDEVYGFLGVPKIYPQSIRPQEVGAYSDLPAATRQTIEAYFKQANEDLAALLGDHYRW